MLPGTGHEVEERPHRLDLTEYRIFWVLHRNINAPKPSDEHEQRHDADHDICTDDLILRDVPSWHRHRASCLRPPNPRQGLTLNSVPEYAMLLDFKNPDEGEVEPLGLALCVSMVFRDKRGVWSIACWQTPEHGIDHIMLHPHTEGTQRTKHVVLNPCERKMSWSGPPVSLSMRSKWRPWLMHAHDTAAFPEKNSTPSRSRGPALSSMMLICVHTVANSIKSERGMASILLRLGMTW